MGNARGTQPSQQHQCLDPNQLEFWSFSWHEIGVYDLPASIDYVLHLTKSKKLNYVGYSQGTTSFFVMASMRPDYNNKIIEANLMAPVAFLKGNRNKLFNAIAFIYDRFKVFLEKHNFFMLRITNEWLMRVADVFCSNVKDRTPLVCKVILAALSSNQINCVSAHFF